MKRDKIRSMYKECSEEITARTNEIQHLLLGEGNVDASILVIADYPSAKEEEYDQNLLEDDRERLVSFLDIFGFGIADVYITHLMKYRPYRVNKQGRIVSRSPKEEEFEFFVPYLEKEITLINPKLIVTLGLESLHRLSKDPTLSPDLHQDQLLVVGVLGKSYKLYPLPHPSHKDYAAFLHKAIEEDKESLVRILSTSQSLPLTGRLTPAMDKKVRKNPEVMGEGEDKETSVRKEDDLEGQEEVAEKVRVFNKIQLSENFEREGRKSYITMIYGGEGYVDDPVLVVLERLSHVFAELGLGIHRIDLYRGNVSMEKALSYIQDSKGVVLGVLVEWLGIGHRMQQFLDECFYRGDESYFKNRPLLGVCLTRHAFEREAYRHIQQSWEYLGGRDGMEIVAAIKSAAVLETNFDWLYGIDKKGEQFYRLLQQRKGWLPTSVLSQKVVIEKPIVTEISQESRVPDYESVLPVRDTGLIEDYDTFVERQQEDIKSLSQLFKKKLHHKDNHQQKSLPERIQEAYNPQDVFEGIFQIVMDDNSRENMVIECQGDTIRSYYGLAKEAGVVISGKESVMQRIFDGKLTMQRAFMTGEIKAKGDFTLINKFDGQFNLQTEKR